LFPGVREELALDSPHRGLGRETVRRLVVSALVLALAAFIASPAAADKRKHRKPAGINGVVLSSTCYGPCIEPPPPEPRYTGQVTVTVNRASDGGLVASANPTDGHFRFRLKRGLYDVSAIPPAPVPCPPELICPAEAQVVIAPCETGETQQVRVRRHRFTHVELHVQNVCIA
jgi:hypothetical protein